MMSPPSRRRVLVAGASALLLPAAPVRATPNDVAKLIAELVGEGTLRDGRVKLDLPVLVENGNAVSMTVSVDAPLQGPAALRSIDVFAEGNPLPHVARFTFGPRAGAPRVATRIRLATSQTVIAVAKLADGSCWRDSVDLIVTIAACIDGS